MAIFDSEAIRFSWELPEQIESAWQLQQEIGGTWPHSKEFFAESLQYRRLLLARAGQRPIAFLIYEVIWGNTAFLSLLEVLAEYQRRGIGKAMVEQLEDRLIASGFGSYVTSSETTNQKTKRFFPSLGFTSIGELNMNHGGELFYLKKLRV